MFVWEIRYQSQYIWKANYVMQNPVRYFHVSFFSHLGINDSNTMVVIRVYLIDGKTGEMFHHTTLH